MEKLSKDPIDNTNGEDLREITFTSENEESLLQAALDPDQEVSPADKPSWSDIIKADDTPEFSDQTAQEEFELAHQQRDDILYTAEQVRTGERSLSLDEAKKLGYHALSLARNKYIGPAEAEAMMVNLAASTQDRQHSTLAHRTINERFNLSSPELRHSSHELARRVIAMSDKDLHPSEAAGIALEELFVEHNGHSSDESIIKQIETAKEKRDEDEAKEIHRKTHSRLIDSYGAAITTIRSAKSEEELNTAGNRILNIAFEKAESQDPSPEDVLLIEAATRILEEQGDKFSKFKSDVQELHTIVEEIVKKAPDSQRKDYEKALADADDDSYLEHVLQDLSQDDANKKIAA